MFTGGLAGFVIVALAVAKQAGWAWGSQYRSLTGFQRAWFMGIWV